MALVEDHNMIQKLAANRAYGVLDITPTTMMSDSKVGRTNNEPINSTTRPK